MPRPAKPPKPRAERVYAPPSDALLSEEDLRAWLADIIPALEAAGCSHPTAHRGLDPDRAVLREVRPADHTVSGWPDDAADGSPAVLLWSVVRPPQLELHLRVAAPAWVQARTLDLRLTGDGACGLAQKAPGYKSARDVNDWLDKHAPRWRVPPSGRLPFVVGIREHNGWEGENWTYWLPLASEQDVLALVTDAPVAPGRDVRNTPFCPRSLAAFGSWRLALRYAPEWRARYICETSRVGYMAFQNWAGNSAQDIAALVADARERGILRWRKSDDGPGLSMWKARISLHGEDGKVVRCVRLA